MNAILRTRAHGASRTLVELTRYVRECVNSGTSRRALLLRLSLLPPELTRPHHRRLARAALRPLAQSDRARLFELANGDLVVVWRGDAEAALALATAELAHLFDDSKAGVDAGSLVVPVALPREADLLLDAIAADRRRGQAPPPRAETPLDAAALTRLEQVLVGADVARFARRKGVHQRLPDGSFALRWEKRYLSVVELAEALVPDRDPQGDLWLFRRLTRSLDRRMLALLAAPDELRGAGPFSLNLNVASVLSPEFLRMDAALPAALRGHVIIDVLPADVMADPAAFLFAREFAHARGYRLLLRGLRVDLLGMFTRQGMGVDWLQLSWDSAAPPPDLGALADDAAGLVLAHADDPEAFAWGRAIGIAHFQCNGDPEVIAEL